MFKSFKNYIVREFKSLFSDPGILFASSGSTTSGIRVSPETALRSPAVFGAVRVLAETMAQIPVRLYRNTPDGGRELAIDHPLYPLLTQAANPWTPAAEFRLLMSMNLALFGNAYAFCNRDDDGAIVELIVLDPRHIVVLIDPSTTEPRYQFTPLDGSMVEYSRADVLHVRSIGLRYGQGDSPVLAAGEAIGLSLVLEQFGAGLFGRGARPSGVIKTSKMLNDVAATRLRNSFAEAHAGGGNAGRTLVLEEGIEFQPFMLSSVDAQFLELRKFQLAEIARIFRVPLHLLGDLDRVTHSNAEALGQQFLSFCVLPLLNLFRDAMVLSLLNAAERSQYFIEFDVSELNRADTASRFTAYGQAVNNGFLNPNEVRARENLPPYSGGEVFMRSLSTGAAPITTGEDAPSETAIQATGAANAV